MNALQAIDSARQTVSSMLLAVNALEQASRDMNEAPKRILVLEEFVSEMDNLTRLVKQRYAHKLHNPRLERQIRSLSVLTERLHLNLAKARRMITKNKVKSLAKVMWISMVGDPLSKLIQLIKDDLNWWLELQKIADSVEQVIVSTAESTPFWRVSSEQQGYPISSKCQFVRSLLESEESHRIILIVGLSGIGKSCLARQVAANPPGKFVNGAVELSFGQWCSISACNGSRTEYHNRLAKRLCRLLVQIGYMKARDETMGDMEDICCALQTALVGKGILILLDDVWEQDIVERFAKLYDNECKYLVTTRNEAVYEITEAEKVELCKDDTREISKDILLYHSLLSIEKLPSVAESLLDRCGHHPLTVAVMGKALRKETRSEKWEKAIFNLSTYATCAPGPVSYVNEKEAESTLTIFGSLEFSLEAMPEDCRRFFKVLAAIAWAEPVPETCLEALWSVLGEENVFPIVVCRLVEGSLLMKLEPSSLYHVHDMVSMYLDMDTDEAIQKLLIESSPERSASIAPWLFIFGKEPTQMFTESKTNFFLHDSLETQVLITLESIIHALMASKSISEFEDSRRRFSRLLLPRVAEFISTGSRDLITAAAKATMIIFIQEDYYVLVQSVEEADCIDRLINLCLDCKSSSARIAVFTLVAKLAEYGCAMTIDKVLTSIPMVQLVELLAPDAEEWHESIFATLISLTKAGNSKAVEIMIASGVDKKLLQLLENGSEVTQHYAIVILKTFHELGFPLKQSSLCAGTLDQLPWNVRLSLEPFVVSDKSLLPSPTPQPFQDVLHKLLDKDSKQVVDALQNLIPIVEKASDPRIQEMILASQLLNSLKILLQRGDNKQNEARSESAFLVMKLACVGGEPYIHKFLELDIVTELFQLMQCNNEELQDSAYTALHQIVFARGGTLVLNRFLQAGLIEMLVYFLDLKSLKTKEVSMLLLLDLVEVGTKPCIEKMFSSQVVEKMVNIEKIGGKFCGTIVKFLKGLDMCKNLSSAERQVMKQQFVRKARAALRGHKLEASLVASVEACLEVSRGASSSRSKR